MKNLLLVDDEIHLTSMVISGLKNLLGPKDYSFFSASNGQEALQILESNRIDFVVTDLRMPVMNGLQLLAHLHSNYSSIPVVVLSSYSSDGIEERLRKLGCLKLLSKPVHVVQLAKAIRELLNKTELGGVIKNISVGGFLQLIEMEGKSCQVKVLNKENLATGRFHFEHGILFDASYGDIRGAPAAQKIIGWDDVEITITFHENSGDSPERRIRIPLMTLLLTSMHQKDEDEAASIYTQPKEIVTSNAESARIQQADHQRQEEKDSWKIEPDASEGKMSQTTITDHVKKESKMDVQKLNSIIESMTKDLGQGLLATDIWTVADGFSIAGHNPQPKATALFNQLTTYLNDTLEGSGFPGLGRYYMLDLLDNKLVIILPMGEYRWGVLVDSSKVQLGLLLNIIVPRIIDAFEEAMTS
ncbi:MAG: response regulator [Candidatus Electrothrix scaldis]|nr:MAG: response regulator [Candidatus Electrothrix sp. GW3-3]